MKATDLYKNQRNKVVGKMKAAQAGLRLGPNDAAATNRREQRKLDQAQGLVPFAVKLDAELATQLRSLATSRNEDLGQLVEQLLRKGLAAE